MQTPRLSVFIITYNEAHDLPACLASVAGIANEIVVLDQGSTDETTAVAEAAGARVLTRAFDGFGTQKQAALEATRGDWVLSIDADERITLQLADEIGAAIRSNDVNGYLVHREVHYLGKRLRFGGAGSEWLPRLARRDHARFTNAAVHERMLIEGPVARLRAPMLHITYRDLSEHLAVIDRYTTAVAADKAAAGKRFHAWHLLRIPIELVTRLILKLGILDGRAGIIWSAMAAHYGFLKYAKLYRSKPQQDQPAHSANQPGRSSKDSAT